MKKAVFVLSIFSSILLLAGCGKHYEYEQKYTIDNNSWSYQDTLDFNFNISDTNRIYNLYLEIEHEDSYAFQNLYTQIHTKFPGGERLDETLSLELANKTGNWLGNCSGSICTLLIPIQENAYFNASGDYEITLEQYMRENPINGIMSISFFLEKTKNTR
ncbi:MAG: gliding motility lipoprotein GldH [Bacteroidetes bacterium]|nr:MAG: gliding motility lipoprotein GldH [Bacteroidota bacterium]